MLIVVAMSKSSEICSSKWGCWRFVAAAVVVSFAGKNVTGEPGGWPASRSGTEGQEPAQWGNLESGHCPYVLCAPGQIEGMRVGGLAHRKRLSRIASERQLQPEARRKARKEVWSVMPSAQAKA
jgi:hypothetical protein